MAAGSASDNRIDKSESAVGSVVRRNSSQLQEEKEEEEDPRKRGKRPGRARLECHLIQKAVAVGIIKTTAAGASLLSLIIKMEIEYIHTRNLNTRVH